MNLRTLLFILALLPSLLCLAKGKESPDTISARRAFVELDEVTLDLLPKSTRLDMLDYFDADSLVKVENNLKGSSKIERLTPDFMEVRLSDVSTLQLRVLKLKGGKEILMTVYTTGDDEGGRDSEVRFFDSNLKKLPKEKYLKEPDLGEFFDLKGYQTNMKEIREMIPFYSIAFEAGPDSPDLSARVYIGDTMTLEDYKIIEMFIKPDVRYIWDGKQYKINKKTSN